MTETEQKQEIRKNKSFNAAQTETGSPLKTLKGSDISRHLYRDFLLGAAVGLIAGGGNFVNGGNAQANAELRAQEVQNKNAPAERGAVNLSGIHPVFT